MYCYYFHLFLSHLASLLLRFNVSKKRILVLLEFKMQQETKAKLILYRYIRPELP